MIFMGELLVSGRVLLVPISPGPSTLRKIAETKFRITSLGLTVEGQALVRTMVENGRLELTMVKIDAWKGAIRYGAGSTKEIPNHKRERFGAGPPGYDQHILDYLSWEHRKFLMGKHGYKMLLLICPRVFAAILCPVTWV